MFLRNIQAFAKQHFIQKVQITGLNLLNFYGAGEGNRTLIISLEGCCSTIELRPHSILSIVIYIGGGSWIRTNVGIASGFTVRPL